MTLRKAKSELAKRFPLATIENNSIVMSDYEGVPHYGCEIIAPPGHYWSSHGPHAVVISCPKSKATSGEFWSAVLDDIRSLDAEPCHSENGCSERYEGVCEFWEEDEE